MTMKFRMVKFARIPSYNPAVLPGDPVWATLKLVVSAWTTVIWLPKRLSFPAYSGEHGTQPRAEPDCSVLQRSA